MSSTEPHPKEMHCQTTDQSENVEVIPPKNVALTGPEGIHVRRTLPRRGRSLIGAWCFVDHYGPMDMRVSSGMDVPPHPHTGLQTVSWLFSGEIEHRDSSGAHALVLPGQVNLMTSGHGICHSEVSTSSTKVLHGVQLWVALADEHRDCPRAFEHHVPAVVEGHGYAVRVFLGSLLGSSSPVRTYSPLLGAELVLDAGAEVSLDVDPSFEHGLLVDSGALGFCGKPLQAGELGYISHGRQVLTIENLSSESSRMMLLGGAPFEEEVVMWWNFLGRSHEDIVAYRQAWQAHSDRFGSVRGYEGEVDRLPAPPLPRARLTPRRHG